MFTTVEGLHWQWARRKRRGGDERNNRRRINKNEALPFPNRLFLSHPAITSVSISLSAFWLIRSNGVCVCVCMCVIAVAMEIVFLYYPTNRTLATCHLSYTHVRLANVLLTIASGVIFCQSGSAQLELQWYYYVQTWWTCVAEKHLKWFHHGESSCHDATSAYLFGKVVFALKSIRDIF